MITYTINTDASFSPKHKRGAWAYWIKGDNNFSSRDSGALDGRIRSSLHAELLSFQKALQVIHQITKPEHRGAVLLFVNTDCMFVIHTLDGTIKSKSEQNKILIQQVQNEVKEYKTSARHVKAHVYKDQDSRTWVNNWCDREAKKALWKEIYG